MHFLPSLPVSLYRIRKRYLIELLIAAAEFSFSFISGNCANAEILLAVALKNNLARSVTLGFTMV
jgi:hypothetical protein